MLNFDNNISSRLGGRTRKPATNSSYKKLAVQWLNKALCFVSSSVLADSFRLRNHQLLLAAKRYASVWRNEEKTVEKMKH